MSISEVRYTSRAEYWFAVLFCLYRINAPDNVRSMSIRRANLFTLAGLPAKYGYMLPSLSLIQGRSGWWVIAPCRFIIDWRGCYVCSHDSFYHPVVNNRSVFNRHPWPTYITSHIGTVCTGGIIVMAAFVLAAHHTLLNRVRPIINMAPTHTEKTRYEKLLPYGRCLRRRPSISCCIRTGC